MAPRIFITGIRSFIGRELLSQCRREGIEASGIDSSGDAEDGIARCDIRDPDLADRIPENADAIVHLAALSRDPDCKGKALECFDVNVMGTLRVAAAARRRGARQIIFASTEWVYDSFPEGCPPKTEESPIDIGRLTSEYALSKLVSEANLRQSWLRGSCPVTILRFGIVYGPRRTNWSAVESLFNAVATEDRVTVGSRRTGRHFIHVSDIASAIRASIGLPGFEVLNVQGDRLVTLGEVIEMSGRLLGRAVEVRETDPDRPSVRPVSNARIRERLRWKPQVDLAAGLGSIKSFLSM